jgi:hypothetical protein
MRDASTSGVSEATTAVNPITIAAASRKMASTVRLLRRPGSKAESSGDCVDTHRASPKPELRVNHRSP